MGYWNDNAAYINKSGNISLGNAGLDDGAGHATYGYAKNDVTLPVSPAYLVSDTLPALTYATNAPKRTLVAATTHKLLVPMPFAFNRSFVASAGVAVNPKGILVKSLALNYRVNTADLTSIAGAIYSQPLVAGAGLPTVTTLATTDAGGTVTQAANAYLLVTTVTTPAFVSVDDTIFWGIVTIVTPMSSTCDILGASWRVALALY